MDAQTLTCLTKAAKQAAANAYCPYSHFSVGAAVLSDEGKMYAGCNVENAAYAVTVCAETNAISTAVADGVKRITAILIYGHGEQLITPCGVCRQVMNEFGDNITLYMVTGSGKVTETTAQKLLPQAFGPHNLTDVDH